MKANSEVTQHAGTDNDQGIISRVRHALQQQPVVSALDLSHINVAVREGNVYLAGHVRSRRPIEETVAGIPDMPGIYSELVDDQELAASVARALASDPRTRSHVFRVYADHGWVRVMGTVPSWEAQEAVEAVIGTQSLVRGVVQLPAIAGEPAPIHRRAVQPPVGAEVIAVEGPRGRVAQVIVDPPSRLVTHMVVETGTQETGLPGPARSNKVVVPVRQIEHVGHNAVYLRRASGALDTYPTFHETDFPPALGSWRPPFPYERASVLWQRKTLATRRRRAGVGHQPEAAEDDFSTKERERVVTGTT